MRVLNFNHFPHECHAHGKFLSIYIATCIIYEHTNKLFLTLILN